MVLYLTENIIEEAVSGNEVVDALNNRQAVLINYNDESGKPHTGKRYIEPYVYGLTKAGNPCVRAYQYVGDTKRGVPKWKLFRLDRIESWEPTQQTFDIEPQARGWAAEAYNNNGDGSMSAVYKTVDLEPAPQTEYEKLKAKTRQLQQSKPINIEQFKDRLQYPEEKKKEQFNPQTYTPEELMSNDKFRQMLQRNLEITKQEERKNPKSGPVDVQKPEAQYQSPVQDTEKRTESKPLDGKGHVETSSQQKPIEKEPNQTGPVINKPKIDAQKSKPEDLMSNQDFQAMLRRNLEISNQEKARRQSRNNLK